MKFGKVINPGEIDFRLPDDPIENKELFRNLPKVDKPEVFIGCAKWNRQDLKGFYPRGTKDELVYYSSQFNSIELNATFYRIFSPEQVAKWRDKTPDDFKFFPKIAQSISHFARLKNVERTVAEYVHSIEQFEEKLGMAFLQMNESFGPKEMDTFQSFIEIWPNRIPLSVEFRDTNWYNEEVIANELFSFLKEKQITSIITDTAGRRDLIHMHLTTPHAFIRYTGANHSTDYNRLDDWFERLKEWMEEGIQQIYFFVHQNHELESPLLSAYLINRFNTELGYNLRMPGGGTATLF